MEPNKINCVPVGFLTPLDLAYDSLMKIADSGPPNKPEQGTSDHRLWCCAQIARATLLAIDKMKG